MLPRCQGQWSTGPAWLLLGAVTGVTAGLRSCRALPKEGSRSRRSAQTLARERESFTGGCERLTHSRNVLVKADDVPESVAGSLVCQPFVFAFVVGVPSRLAVSPLAAGEPGVASKPASPVAGPTQVQGSRPQHTVPAPPLHARKSLSLGSIVILNRFCEAASVYLLLKTRCL